MADAYVTDVKELNIKMKNDEITDPLKLTTSEWTLDQLGTFEVLKPEEERSLIFPIVHFEFNKSEILENTKKNIFFFAESWMVGNAEESLFLLGYTDKVGSTSYNENLGLERALSV